MVQQWTGRRVTQIFCSASSGGPSTLCAGHEHYNTPLVNNRPYARVISNTIYFRSSILVKLTMPDISLQQSSATYL